jgi:hypothetical protein
MPIRPSQFLRGIVGLPEMLPAYRVAGYPQGRLIHSGKFNFLFNFIDSGLNSCSKDSGLRVANATKRVQRCD